MKSLFILCIKNKKSWYVCIYIFKNARILLWLIQFNVWKRIKPHKSSPVCDLHDDTSLLSPAVKYILHPHKGFSVAAAHSQPDRHLTHVQTVTLAQKYDSTSITTSGHTGEKVHLILLAKGDCVAKETRIKKDGCWFCAIYFTILDYCCVGWITRLFCCCFLFVCFGPEMNCVVETNNSESHTEGAGIQSIVLCSETAAALTYFRKTNGLLYALKLRKDETPKRVLCENVPNQINQYSGCDDCCVHWAVGQCRLLQSNSLQKHL